MASKFAHTMCLALFFILATMSQADEESMVRWDRGGGRFSGFDRDERGGGRFSGFDRDTRGGGRFSGFDRDERGGGRFTGFDREDRGGGRFTGLDRDTRGGGRFSGFDRDERGGGRFSGDRDTRGGGRFTGLDRDTRGGARASASLFDRDSRGGGRFNVASLSADVPPTEKRAAGFTRPLSKNVGDNNTNAWKSRVLGMGRMGRSVGDEHHESSSKSVEKKPYVRDRPRF